jgi:hypothetical protein
VKPPVFDVDGSTELPVGQPFACFMNWLIDGSSPHAAPIPAGGAGGFTGAMS